MSHVRRVQGWGFNSLVTLEAAADVMTFDQLRYTPNSGPYCLGARPASCDREPPSNSTTRCRGNFTAVPAIVALRPTNALLWMGRADGCWRSSAAAATATARARETCAWARAATRRPLCPAARRTPP